jgi:hypothetical protein
MYQYKSSDISSKRKMSKKITPKTYMNNKILPISILFLVIIGLGIVGLSKGNGASGTGEDPVDTDPIDISTTGITYFYGIGCPYCDVVDKYVSDNNVMDVVDFEKKEVYNNKGNADELMRFVDHCGLNPNYIGVPFMWTGEACLVGDQDIISFLESELEAE